MINPTEGGIACFKMQPEARQKKVVSEKIDTATSTVYVLLYDANYNLAIEGASFVTSVAGTGNTVESIVKIGTFADPDAFVKETNVPDDVAAGTAVDFTLADTEQATHGYACGSPVLSKGTALVATITTGSGGTDPKGNIVITYSVLDKGQ